MFIIYVVGYLFALALLGLLLVSVVVLLVTDPYPQVLHFPRENEYWESKSRSWQKFRSLTEPHSLYLSVIVPAYNEEDRLPPMLNEALQYLELKKKENVNYTYEIIVVSDGSTDRTPEVAYSYSDKYGVDKVKCLKLVKNRGKGGAVRMGIERASGAVILFADADGATKFEDLSKLEKCLEECVGARPGNTQRVVGDSTVIVIGSRAHMEKESLASRSIFRTVLMYGFHFLVWLFTVRDIRDTQCGFKLFTRKAARICFQNLHVERWAFDVELLYIAQRLNIPISEISVRWTEIEGSKVTPVWSWIQMGCDLGLIWLKYRLGAWRLRVTKVD